MILYIIYVWCVFCILAASDNLAKHFTDECVKICSEALKFLHGVVENLKQRKVTIQQLDMLTSHLSQVVDLFSPKVVNRIIDDASFNIADLIAKRNSEVEKFKSYCSKVKILLEHCGSIANGMPLIFKIVLTRICIVL